MVADPSAAGDFFALADAQPELVQSAAMLRLAGRTLVDQKAEVVRLQNTLDEVKKEMQDHVEMMDTFIVNAHFEDTTLEQMKALTPGERVALDSLQGAMLELLDLLNDPELAEVEPDPGSVLFSPTAASPPAAAAPSLTSEKNPAALACSYLLATLDSVYCNSRCIKKAHKHKQIKRKSG